jgi:hypothetical protein
MCSSEQHCEFVVLGVNAELASRPCELKVIHIEGDPATVRNRQHPLVKHPACFVIPTVVVSRLIVRASLAPINDFFDVSRGLLQVVYLSDKAVRKLLRRVLVLLVPKDQVP